MHRPRTWLAPIAPIAVIACALTATMAPASAAVAPHVPDEYVQGCGGTSWVAGTTDVCDGSVVYRDYVYDDEGADTGDLGYSENTASAFGTLAHPAGDIRYPPGDINSADLVNLRLTRRGDMVDVVAELNALFHPNSTILAVAVDTDGNPATGGGRWGDLGIRSAGWDALYLFQDGDVATNTIRGSFPLPAARHWRVQAVTAQAATHQVMNVAFRGPDEHAAYKLDYTNPSPYPPSGQGAWFEDDQAAALAAGDVSRFGYVVDTASLRHGVTKLSPVGPGLHERVYTSAYTLPPGKGMTYTGIKGRGSGGSSTAFAQVFNFVGRYQPYGIYIPPVHGPHGLQMEWHGSNQGIVAQINQPGMQRRFGDERNRILVVPEARGPNGYGSDISERDLLDVLHDVEANYAIDRSRVFSSGYSQGGYIAFRMAMLYPDVFAGFTSWVGFTGDDLNGTPLRGTVSVTAGAVGNMIDYVGNLRHVPGSMLFSGEDELVQVPSSTAMQRAFDATDDIYTWYLHNPADHFTYALADDWAKEAAYSAPQSLVTNPDRVTFRTDAALDDPAHGIRHDRAYWASSISGRHSGFIDTDLTSHGCGRPAVGAETVEGAGAAPAPWVSISRQATTSSPTARRQVLEGSVANVASARVDLAATCLGSTFTYRITSDGPATLTLSDGRQIHLVAGTNEGVTRR